MTMGEAIRSLYSNYATFSGRAPRSAFWWVALAAVILEIVLMVPFYASMGVSPDGTVAGPSTLGMAGMGLFGLIGLATFIPYLALVVRRLHDTDKSGWFILIQFVPLVGPIIILVFLATKGTQGSNRFGPDPLGGSASSF